MQTRNNRTNALIKGLIVMGDFLLLNGLLALFVTYGLFGSEWSTDKIDKLWLVSNMSMMLAQWKYSTIIHLRMVSGANILKRIFYLMATQTAISYIIMKVVDVQLPVGWHLLKMGITLTALLITIRLTERMVIKWFRQAGRNLRTVSFVGSDPALSTLYERMASDPTLGYHLKKHFQQPKELLEKIRRGEPLCLGDELYVCLPIRQQQLLWELSDYCDRHVIRFYYIPASGERPEKRLRREDFDEIELYTTHDIPLENPAYITIKRIFDILFSAALLVVTIPLFPLIAFLIRWQSPGPIFFRQDRTGINARNFICYKFRSMHVNSDADSRQAVEHDPRAFPFGNFMRKYNIDELPQFWNVLRGDMSVVGPRPHMLMHTEQYSQLICEYMVRHFVKPGITGWAQVTGFRGETKELWQMEERVKRDIWYIEHWSIWLDIRIIWMTIKGCFIHDSKAY